MSSAQPMPRQPSPASIALAITGFMLVAGNLRAGLTSVGPVLDRIQSDLGLTSFAASMLISLPLLAFALVSPIVPPLAHRIGLERTLGGALLLLAAGIALRSTPGPALLWIGTALLGIAIAILNVALPSLVKRDFPNKIGQVTGAYSAVQSIFAAIAAGIAVPIAGASLLDWRLSLGIWAGLALVTLGVFAPRLLHGTAPRPAERTPRSRAHETQANQPASEASIASVRPGDTAPETRRSVWSSGLAWTVTAFMGAQSLFYYVLITWLPSIEIAAGIDPGTAGFHLLLMNAAGILGSLLSSALIPRMRDQRGIGVGSGVLLGISTGGLLLAPSWSAVWASLAGLGGGLTIVLGLSLFGLRTRNHHRAAEVSGMAQSIGYLFAAAGPPSVGALHDLTGNWTPALIALTALSAVVALAAYHAGKNRIIE